MKNHLYKAALAAALGLAGAVAAHAQSSDDILVGFTSPQAASVGGTKYDYILDAGNLDTLIAGGAQQISLSTLLSPGYNDSTFTTDLGATISGGTAYVGAWGGTSGSFGDVFLSSINKPTTPTAANIGNASAVAYTVSLGAVAQGGASVFEQISESPGHQGATGNSSFAGYVPSPLETISSAVGTGTGTETLTIWESQTTSRPPVDEGFVSILFGSNGDISGLAWDETATAPVSAVPEPATYGIIGGMGVLLLGLRRQLTGKIA